MLRLRARLASLVGRTGAAKLVLMIKRCRRSQISITYPPLSVELTDEPSRLNAANALSHTSPNTLSY